MKFKLLDTSFVFPVHKAPLGAAKVVPGHHVDSVIALPNGKCYVVTIGTRAVKAKVIRVHATPEFLELNGNLFERV